MHKLITGQIKMNDCLSQFNKSDKQFCEIGNNWPINLTNNVFKIGQLLRCNCEDLYEGWHAITG